MADNVKVGTFLEKLVEKNPDLAKRGVQIKRAGASADTDAALVYMRIGAFLESKHEVLNADYADMFEDKNKTLTIIVRTGN